MTSARDSEESARDLIAQPLSAILLWGLPLAIGWSADLLHAPAPLNALMWALALAWMGAGCAFNARRCNRLHCYLAAPVLLLGAAAMTGVALGLTPLGPHTGSYVIKASLALGLLTFLVEPVWGKYGKR